MTVKDLKDKLQEMPDDMQIGVVEASSDGKQWVRWSSVLLYRVRTDKNGTISWDVKDSCKEVLVLR